MLGIKKFDLITTKVSDFTISDLKYVTDFRYAIEIDTVSLYDVQNISMLVISFVLIPKKDVLKYTVTIQFKKLGSLQLSSGGTVIQLSGFEILDISDRGWDSIMYLVRDFESDDEFKFYCNDIEVISIEETDLIVE